MNKLLASVQLVSGKFLFKNILLIVVDAAEPESTIDDPLFYRRPPFGESRDNFLYGSEALQNYNHYLVCASVYDSIL